MDKTKLINKIKRLLILIFVAESVVWLALPIMAFSNDPSGGFYSADQSIVTTPANEEKPPGSDIPFSVDDQYDCAESFDATNVIMAEHKIAQVGLGIYEYLIESDGSAVIMVYGGAEPNVKIPATLDGHPVTTIGECAFYNKKVIKSIVVPEGVTRIEMSAFQHCQKLESVTLPQSLIYIDDLAFAENTALKSVTIPDNVKEIGEFAFGRCTSLTEIKLPASTEVLGMSPFDESSGIASIEVDENNEHFSSENGVLFNKDKTELIYYPAAKEDESYTVPESVNAIGLLAFSGNNSLHTVEVTSNVTKIENMAFYRCRYLTIYGHEGSEAERYADENNIKFALLAEVLAGDVDGNGLLDYNDYSMIVSYVRCRSPFPSEIETDPECRARADVNGDGVIDAFDAIGIEIRINKNKGP